IVISLLVLIVIVISFTYAFFSGNIVGNGNINVSANIDESMIPIFTAVPSGDLILDVTDADMLPSQANNTVPISANETIEVSLIGGTPLEEITCTFSFVWTKLADSDTYVPTTGRGSLKENTLSIADENSTTVFAETNIDSLTSGNTIATRSISSHGSLNTQVYTVTQSFYNLDLNQTMYNASYKSKVSIENVSCSSAPHTMLLTDYIANNAPRSGTDAVSSSPWILTSDHEGELRYAGKNPDNYIQFNGELWRIIGVMPDMTYCTGTYGYFNECNNTSTGNLVKIIRNASLGNFLWDYKQTGVGSSITPYGSNEWSDSQLSLMLNGPYYLYSAYDANYTNLHGDYSVLQGQARLNNIQFYSFGYDYLNESNSTTTVYKPSSATTSSYTNTSGTVPKKIGTSALEKVASVNWNLYGTSSYSTATEGSPAALYNKERNISNSGSVYTHTSLLENRAVYWYGKIGLMYPSDYGYATNGGSTYNRSTCLEYQMSGWGTGSYKTDCALNDWLLFQNITSTAPGSYGAYQWTISPYSGSSYEVFTTRSGGTLGQEYVISDDDINVDIGVRPVLYLKADT
ncbi:MAG: hypothetical protein IKI04_01780, partial [Bacilli bacterium]|nr:hypothetical protein [Bacilli bacterium]